jgi:hypothetical protein
MKKKTVFVWIALVTIVLISCAAIEKSKHAALIVEGSARDVESCKFLGNVGADIVAYSTGTSADTFVASAKQHAKEIALDMGATNVVFDAPGGVGSRLTGKAYKCASQ